MRWAKIEGYNQPYEVSDTGLVRNGDMILKGHVQKRRCRVRLSYGPEFRGMNRFVHRLVATAFIPNPDNKPQINHIDGNPGNNCVENLEWCTKDENEAHAVRLRLRPRGLKNHAAKLTDQQVSEIQALCAEGTMSLVAIGQRYGISDVHVGNIRRGHRDARLCDKSTPKYRPLHMRPPTHKSEAVFTAVRSLLADGLRRRVIAERLGVSIGFVFNVAHGAVYKPKNGGGGASPTATAPSVFSPQTAAA